ncbi:MAG: hypothetical protein IK990_14245 [Ruminiclostridium sp.]|nr:hypothetical protein [Ruminiclostridium sp.]
MEETPIVGLGIFMTKESMDDVSYEYRDNLNILTIKKILSKQNKMEQDHTNE